MLTTKRLSHLAAAVIVTSADYGLASTWVAASYGARGMAGIVLWLFFFRAFPLGGDMAVPNWSRIRVSLSWLCSFGEVCLPVGLCVLASLALASRVVGWNVRYELGAIGSMEEIWPFLLHGVIAAPLVEELIHRGIVYPRLEQAMTRAQAVFVSGCIFWVLHWVDRGAVSPVNHLLAGWILAWAAQATRSCLAPTLLHAMGNLLVLGLDIVWIQDPNLVRAVLGA